MGFDYFLGDIHNFPSGQKEGMRNLSFLGREYRWGLLYNMKYIEVFFGSEVPKDSSEFIATGIFWCVNLCTGFVPLVKENQSNIESKLSTYEGKV